MSSSRRWVGLGVALAALSVLGWVLAIDALASRALPFAQAGQSSITSQITYNATGQRRIISPVNQPIVLHMLDYRTRGGPVTVRWYDSDFESLVRHEIGLVSIDVDRKPVASTVKTSLTGTYDDGQGDLAWHGSLTPGRHLIVVQVEGTGQWGMPYADPGRIGTDELIVNGPVVR